MLDGVPHPAFWLKMTRPPLGPTTCCFLLFLITNPYNILSLLLITNPYIPSVSSEALIPRDPYENSFSFDIHCAIDASIAPAENSFSFDIQYAIDANIVAATVFAVANDTTMSKRGRPQSSGHVDLTQSQVNTFLT